MASPLVLDRRTLLQPTSYEAPHGSCWLSVTVDDRPVSVTTPRVLSSELLAALVRYWPTAAAMDGFHALSAPRMFRSAISGLRRALSKARLFASASDTAVSGLILRGESAD